MYATSYATATPLAAALVRVGGREPVGGLPSGGRWQLACSASATSGRCRCLRFLLPCELHVVRICLFTSVRGSPTFRTCLAVVGCPRGRNPSLRESVRARLAAGSFFCLGYPLHRSTRIGAPLQRVRQHHRERAALTQPEDHLCQRCGW